MKKRIEGTEEEGEDEGGKRWRRRKGGGEKKQVNIKRPRSAAHYSVQ